MTDINPFQHRTPGYSRDNTSSIYSRSTDTAKDTIPITTIPTTLQIKPSLPKINLLDHQISIASGSTMALETTRPQLRKSKTQPEMSMAELKTERIQQHRQQGLKNDFYCKYFESFHQLISTTIDATQSLALQYHFNRANSPSGDPRLIRAIVSLRVALNKSRAEETSTEQEWKQQWKVSPVRQSSLR
ncbi:unnamed protein product [Penicillium roqueforti FM164]|uniref:Genomic scaffold, ProqFM164S02 n=1 Tax=Penicillium roqueforti (strain FM164) TaxID=1365484 RepID=W6Q991_PENRF|nr:unnamed protein product [Penicillium roqueforti FM164]